MRFSAGISTPNNLGIIFVTKSYMVTKALVKLLNLLTSHQSLLTLSSLPLLVPRVLADDAHHVLALHNLAGFTKSFD